MAKITNQQAEQRISDRKAFETKGGFWATELTGSTFSITTGELPDDLAKELNKAIRRGSVDYVIYSYRTPIAWVEKDGFDRPQFRVPEVVYSQTTTRHQAIVRRAWNV